MKIAIWIISFLLLSSRPLLAQSSHELIVYAPMSLIDVLSEVVRAYELQTGIDVQTNFAGTHTLRLQIEAGAPCDIFISAHREHLDILDGKGFIEPLMRRPFLANSLILIESNRRSTQMARLADLAKINFLYISLADPEYVPAGQYAKEALVKSGIWEQIKKRVVPALDVRAALTQVALGNTEFGIVYKTDIHSLSGLHVIYEIPSSLHSPIVYEAVLLKKTAHKRKTAQEFLKFLISKDAVRIYQKYGFDFLNQ